VATLNSVLVQHRDISKETLQTLLVGVDSSLTLRVVQIGSDNGLMISADSVTPSAVKHGVFADVLPAAEELLLEYEVPLGNKATFFRACFTGSGIGRFRVEQNGADVWEGASSYFERSAEFSQRFDLAENVTLKFFARNETISSNSNTYKVFAYLREGPV